MGGGGVVKLWLMSNLIILWFYVSAMCAMLGPALMIQRGFDWSYVALAVVPFLAGILVWFVLAVVISTASTFIETAERFRNWWHAA